MSEVGDQLGQCGCCNEQLDHESHLQCIQCLTTFHYPCVCIAENSVTSEQILTWKCAACTISAPKTTKKERTPSRNVCNTRGSKRPALSSPPQSSPEKPDHDFIRKTIEDVISKQMDGLISKMKNMITYTISRELKPIQEEITQMSISLDYLSESHTEILKEQEANKRIVKELQKENSDLKSRINDLSSRLNQIEQHSRSCNIELHCVPERKNENLLQIATKLGSVIGHNIQECDIKNCTRIAKQDSTSSRPRSIVLQLESPRMRDHVLAAAINYNKANPSNKLNSQLLGFSGDQTPIFVAEHLSPSNKALHAATRKKANEKGYKYVWVRGGKIFVRKSDGSDSILVKNVDVLDKKVI